MAAKKETANKITTSETAAGKHSQKSVEDFYKAHKISSHSKAHVISTNPTSWNKSYFAVQLSNKLEAKFS